MPKLMGLVDVCNGLRSSPSPHEQILMGRDSPPLKMLKHIQDLLYCPDCHGDLEWSIQTETKKRILDASIRCGRCDRIYAVKDEIAFFLLTENPSDDLWQIVDSSLATELKKNPRYEHQLMRSDLSSLNAADKFLRATVLDERGEFDLAKRTRRLAVKELYTPSYNRQYATKENELQALLEDEDGVIVDLASGMTGLAEPFSSLKNSVVFTDISPSILCKNQKRLQYFGLYDKVSLITFDAKNMPFGDETVPIFTSNMGLTNIRDSKGFVSELSRCLKGTAYFITFFFPDNEDENAQLLEEMGMDLAFEDRLKRIAGPHFNVKMLHPARCDIEPTVQSEIFNVGIDTLPVEPTTVTWAIVTLEPRT
ncbi:MAG: class I SAM-dependent methyltransferase [Promethearchaeia archaeon]